MKIFMGLCILALVSCGKDSGNGSGSGMSDQRQDEQGVYRAVLTAVNSGVSQNASLGTSTVKVQGDEFQIKINMTDTPVNVTHLQDIRTGLRCPTKEDDTNNDGFIDAAEGSKVFGELLIPLDGDLNSQAAENKNLPRSNASGNYTYSENASLSRLMSDLRTITDRELNLSGRHFVVYSIPETIKLPETVAKLEGLSRNESLPIACGKIIRILDEEN